MIKVIKPVVFCLILLIVIFSIDYYVDSYAAIRVTYEKVANISSKYNYCVGTEIPLSERKPKWALINLMEKKDFIVMGSSRVEMLTSENMEEESFYNICVSGGSTVGDYLAETYILYSQNKLPERMLIEISPSIFNVNSGEARWREWDNNTVYMEQILEGGPPNVRQPSLGIQWKDLLSPSYFQYNVQNLMEGKRVWVESSDDYDNPIYLTVHSDGSYMYSREYQNKYTEEQILEQTENICNNRTVYLCSHFMEIDEDLKKTFEELVWFLVSHDVEISFYLPPYSEPMYNFISTDDMYEVILDVEEYILAFASENNLKVFGSYDPEESELQIKDLYDPYHVREEKIIDTLWER